MCQPRYRKSRRVIKRPKAAGQSDGKDADQIKDSECSVRIETSLPIYRQRQFAELTIPVKYDKFFTVPVGDAQ